jgi:hypothetical protein
VQYAEIAAGGIGLLVVVVYALEAQPESVWGDLFWTSTVVPPV